MGDISQSEIRELTTIVVNRETTSQPPILRSDLPFLAFEAKGVTSAPYTEPGTFYHTHKFLVKFSSPPPNEDFAGTVRVIDPWDSSRVETIGVHGRPVRALQVHPAVLTFKADVSQPVGKATFSSALSATCGP